MLVVSASVLLGCREGLGAKWTIDCGPCSLDNHQVLWPSGNLVILSCEGADGAVHGPIKERDVSTTAENLANEFLQENLALAKHQHCV